MLQTPSLPNEATLQELLQRYNTELMALNDSNLRLPLVLRDRALEQSHHLLEEFGPLITMLGDFYSNQRVQKIKAAYDGLLEQAFVFHAASMEAERPWSSQQKQEFQELAAKIRDYDVRWMKWNRALYHGDATANDTLDKIHAGRGYIDDAEDVIALVNLLLAYSGTLFPNPFFTEKEVRGVEAEARKFLWWLQGRDETTPPKGSPPDLRIRAYNLWLNTYNTVARAGRDMTDDEAEGLRRFPRISSLKTRAYSASSDEAASTPNRVENFGS